MSGLVCLQGGGEFADACADVDRAVLERAPGPVVVLPWAGAPGRERETAGRNAVRYLEGLGAEASVVEPADAVRALGAAAVAWLPGGSPARLLEEVRPVADALRAVLDRGGAVVGASAGAMVACGRAVLPDRGGEVVDGLGLVPRALVVPHHRAWSPRLRWTAPGQVVVGLPECAGLLVQDGVGTVAGSSPVTLRWPDGAAEHLLAGASVRLDG